MSTFKHKPEKLKFLSNINTLDEIHKSHVCKFKAQNQSINQKQQIISELSLELKTLEKKNRLEITFDDAKRKSTIKSDINKLKSEIANLENGYGELEYYSKVTDILIDYYDILNENEDNSDQNKNQENNDENDGDTGEDKNNKSETGISDKLVQLNKISQLKRKEKKPTKKRMKKVEEKVKGNILSFFSGSSGLSEVSEKDTDNVAQVVSNRATLHNEYLSLVDTNSLKQKKYSFRMCTQCNIEKSLDHTEGSYVCQNCGETEHIVIESEIPNHKDSVTEKPRYPYKRLNHLTEWLNQFQAKESTDIPKDIYDGILGEIKKQRLLAKIQKAPYVKKRKIIKEILKKFRYVQYYEHISFIISKVTKTQPQALPRDIEEKIKQMFKKIQDPFMRHCPPERINFLNYSYILNKLFGILGLHEISDSFPLPKSKDVLKKQDTIWKLICYDLSWEYESSI